MAFIKGLVQLDYYVTIVCLEGASEIYDGTSFEFMKHVDIIYINKKSTYGYVIEEVHRNDLIRKMRKIYQLLKIYDYTKSMAEHIKVSCLKHTRYDYIISISDPKSSHLAARKLIAQGVTYKKWIQYWGDPFATDITNKSVYPMWIYKKIESKLLEKADRVVYTSPITLRMQQKIYRKYGTKMYYCPTGYISELITNNSDNKIRIGYYGAYYSSIRNIVPLYEACLSLKDFATLSIVGDSDLKLDSKENISCRPRGNVEEEEKNTDIFVCILNRKGTQIPGKIYYYAASNKPILVILDGCYKSKIKEIFSQYDRFYFAENNQDDIKKKVISIIEENREFSPCKDFAADNVARIVLG